MVASALCCAPASFGAAAPVALRIDYLPNLIYDGECLTLCGAVVNRTRSTVRGKVSCWLTTSRRPRAGTLTQDVVAPPGKEGRFEMGWKLVRLKEVVRLNVALIVKGEEVGKAEVAVYPASLELPELTPRDDFMVDGDGRRVVLVVRRQERERKSRWAVAKWIKRTVAGSKVEPASALFVGDLLAGDEKSSYVAALKASDQFSLFSFLAVRHPRKSEQAGPAILQTLCEFSRSALKRRYDLVLFFVGSEEARLGTDVDEFRRAIDLMCGAVKARGCKHVGFIAPVAPALLSARTARYRRAIRSVADVANARICDPQPALTRAGWGRGPEPGLDAEKAIADEIEGFVKTVTGER